MNKTTGIIIGFVIIAIVAGVTYASMQKDDAMMDTKKDASATMEDAKNLKTMEEDDAMVDDKDSDMMDAMEADEEMSKGAEAMKKAGSYEEYSSDKLARAETGDVVLFFHASWCPSCRGLNADIEKNLEAIPAGVSILKVNYDTESELKKKYGVTYQHTLVQVNADGTMINKWSGSPTLSSLASQIN